MISLQIKRVEKEDQIFSCGGKNERELQISFFDWLDLWSRLVSVLGTLRWAPRCRSSQEQVFQLNHETRSKGNLSSCPARRLTLRLAPVKPVLHGRRATLRIDEAAVHELALLAQVAVGHSRQKSSRQPDTEENQLPSCRHLAIHTHTRGEPLTSRGYFPDL